MPPSAAATRIGAFNGLRAYALITVVAMHLFGAAGVFSSPDNDTIDRLLWTVLGNTIDLFFVISGFLLFLPVARRGFIKGGASAFYVRRLARIQPEYWLVLVAILLMIAFVPAAVQPPVPTVGQFLIHVVDLQMIVRLFDPAFPTGLYIDGALWMIPVLAGLYLVFPPFSRLMLKRAWVALPLALAVTVIWKWAAHHGGSFFAWLAGTPYTDVQLMTVNEQSPAFAWSFAVGMFAAVLYHRATTNPGTRWRTLGLPIAFGIAAVAWIWTGLEFSAQAVLSATGMESSSLGRSLILPNLIGTVARGVFVLAVALGPLMVTRIFDNGFATLGSKLSFGVYLIHLPIAVYAGQLLDLPTDGNLFSVAVWLLAVVPLSLVWAWFSRRFVGVPAIEWSERRLKAKAN